MTDQQTPESACRSGVCKIEKREGTDRTWWPCLWHFCSLFERERKLLMLLAAGPRELDESNYHTVARTVGDILNVKFEAGKPAIVSLTAMGQHIAALLKADTEVYT